MCIRHTLSSDRTTKAMSLVLYYKPQPPLMINPDHLQPLAAWTKKTSLNMKMREVHKQESQCLLIDTMFMNFALRHSSRADNDRPWSKTEKGQTVREQERKDTKPKQIMLGKRYSNKHKEKCRESEAKEKVNRKHTKLRKEKRGKCNSKINAHRIKQIWARKRKSTSKTEKGGETVINIRLPWQDVLYSQMRMTILTRNY